MVRNLPDRVKQEQPRNMLVPPTLCWNETFQSQYAEQIKNASFMTLFDHIEKTEETCLKGLKMPESRWSYALGFSIMATSESESEIHVIAMISSYYKYDGEWMEAPLEALRYILFYTIDKETRQVLYSGIITEFA